MNEDSLQRRRNAIVVEKRITHRLTTTLREAGEKAVKMGYSRYEVGKMQAKVNQDTAKTLPPTGRVETEHNIEMLSARCKSVGVGGALELLQAIGTLIGDVTDHEDDPDEAVRELERYVVRETGRNKMREAQRNMIRSRL